MIISEATGIRVDVRGADAEQLKAQALAAAEQYWGSPAHDELGPRYVVDPFVARPSESMIDMVGSLRIVAWEAEIRVRPDRRVDRRLSE